MRTARFRRAQPEGVGSRSRPTPCPEVQGGVLDGGLDGGKRGPGIPGNGRTSIPTSATSHVSSGPWERTGQGSVVGRQTACRRRGRARKARIIGTLFANLAPLRPRPPIVWLRLAGLVLKSSKRAEQES